jgi:hypothetical protein
MGAIRGGDILERDEWDATREAGTLWHGTISVRLTGILREGLAPGSCWGTEAVARYFARRERGELGGRAAFLVVPLSRFDDSRLVPDEQMADFPIFEDYDVRQCAWEAAEEAGKPDWRDSLRVFEAVAYDAHLAVSADDVLGRRTKRVADDAVCPTAMPRR